MPELPEVEIARGLIADHALRRRIADVTDVDPFTCRPHTPAELRGALLGRMLTAARRRGKLLWCETSGTESPARSGPLGPLGPLGPDLGIHLGMTGSIVVVSDGKLAEGGERAWREVPVPVRKAEWNRCTLAFADGGRLTLLDPRRLGRIRLDPDIDALGPDAGEVTLEEFRGLVAKGTIAVKARLLDQSKIAGIGNLLADEVLWEAKVPPTAPAGTLPRPETDRLYHALRSALASAIARGGVHTGEVIPARHPGGTCPRCGAEMKHATVGGRSTWWCSREQTR